MQSRSVTSKRRGGPSSLSIVFSEPPKTRFSLLLLLNSFSTFRSCILSFLVRRLCLYTKTIADGILKIELVVYMFMHRLSFFIQNN